MAWVGWFKFGNTNIVNNELSRGMAESASPAPFNWFTGPRFPTVQQALDPNLPYNQASIQQTPWYDPTIPESERFFGVYGLGVSGLVGSTRNVAVVESIEDGGVLGIPRKATKPLVYSVLLTARGRDALEYGFEWLDAVLDADACGMHGDICGVSDLQFYSDVPPARGTVDYYSDWLTTATNLLTNPSMEAAGSAVTVRTNLSIDPLATSYALSTGTLKWSARWAGPSGYVQTVSTVAGASDGPVAGVTSYIRKTWTAVGTGTASNIGFQHSLGQASGYAVTPGNSLTVSSYVRVSALPTVAGTFHIRYDWYDASGVQVGSWQGGAEFTPKAGQWVRVTDTHTVPATAAFVAISTDWDGAGGLPVGLTLDGTGLNVEASTLLGDLIWGSRPASGDFTYAWTGTANASTSVQQGTLVAKTAMGNGQGIQSSAWSASGGKSVRLIPNTTSTATTLLIADTAGNYQYILVPGKTYTLVATRYLPAPLTGALSAYAGSFALITTNTGSQFSAQLPNSTDPATGTELRWTFTIPAGAGATTLRLGHGGSIGSGDVWWDNVALVEGTYAGEYFDGSNLPAGSDINLTRVFWDGTADASTSELQTREALTRPQTDDEWAATVNLMARYMHGVGTIAGPMVAQELESGPFNAYIVTFTLQATRPYIYSASTDLDLPPQIPIVYQDIPYNLAQYPSFELTDGTTPVVATNYVLNPSVETDATGWAGSAATISGTSPAAFFTSGRVTGELSSVGNSSFRDRILGDGSTVVTNSKAQLSVSQTVDLSAIASSAGKRPSVTVWAAATILAGASGSSIDGLSAYLQWLDSSGTSLRTDTLGTASAGTYNGHVFSQQSMVPPAGWSKAVVLVNCNVTWSSSSTPANNSDIRLYVDAMGVTIP